MSPPDPVALRATRALTALAIDPAALRGLVLRARVGPARAAFEAQLPRLPGLMHRVPPTVSDTQLFGGLNVAATLAEGRPVSDLGLIERPATLVIPMAERIRPDLAARLGQVLDRDLGHGLILLDESAEPDETAPEALMDRLAFHLDLGALPARAARFPLPAPADIDHARAHLSAVRPRQEDMCTLTVTAARLGIDSLRAPLLALRTARALAALDRCGNIEDHHLQDAAELVFPSRARVIPDVTPDPPAPESPQEDTEAKGAPSSALPEDILVQAVAALLPPDLLARIAARRRAKAPSGSSGAGLRRIGNRRGRPLPARPGKPDGRHRIDPVATLRAAAPWQTLRRAWAKDDRPVVITPPDLRIRRFEDRSDRLLIFTVDASGSAAVARLSEAKGAVELLLAQAYAKRDQVALIAFRGQAADLLLPPTRSLVQGKRRLAALPGGGGTPLATGLQSATALARLSRRRGLSPMLVLLTDGRANVTLSGDPGRDAAFAEATAIARQIHEDGIESLLIDTALRPDPKAAELAGALGARYLALPRADARGISAAVDHALER